MKPTLALIVIALLCGCNKEPKTVLPTLSTNLHWGPLPNTVLSVEELIESQDEVVEAARLNTHYVLEVVTPLEIRAYLITRGSQARDKDGAIHWWSVSGKNLFRYATNRLEPRFRVTERRLFHATNSSTLPIPDYWRTNNLNCNPYEVATNLPPR